MTSQAAPAARFAALIYRWRWPLAVASLLTIVGVFMAGTRQVGAFNHSVRSLGDLAGRTPAEPPLIFDPSLDVWFSGLADDATSTYYEIEDRFVAEDFVAVSFSAAESPLGVFDRSALATIARLTEQFLTIPGVRHVRSLTYSPWIRAGKPDDLAAAEDAAHRLVVGDFVVGDPQQLSDDQLIERMVAVLGAEAASKRVGRARVRDVLGPEANFADHIGEPSLVGTVVDETGTTTAIQVQILRRNARAADLEGAAAAAYSTSYQRAALRGIEHFLRQEAGLVVPSADRADLVHWMEGQEDPEARRRMRLALEDPRTTFMVGPDGAAVRKVLELEDQGDGTYVDVRDPSAPVDAPAGFVPEPRSSFRFHLGGQPLIERNFEQVGMADGGLMPLMFLIIAVCLAFLTRSIVGAAVSLTVAVGAILATIGFGFAKGDLLNNMTMMTPNLLTAVGIADAVHLVSAWVTQRPHATSRRALIEAVVRQNAVPVLLTSITTAVGFCALTLSSVRPIAMLGTSAAFGTLVAYVLSMTLVPAVLSLLPVGSRRGAVPHAPLALSADRSRRLAELIVRRRAGIVGIALVLVVAACIGVARVEIDSDTRRFFPREDPVMADFDWMERHLAGGGDLEIVFGAFENLPPADSALDDGALSRLEALRTRRVASEQGHADMAPLGPAEQAELAQREIAAARAAAQRIGVSPQVLGELDRFEARLREDMARPTSPLHLISDLISPLDILRKMHQVQNGGSAAFYRVPGDADVASTALAPRVVRDPMTDSLLYVPAQSGETLVAQYYLQYENGARPGESLSTQLSADRSQIRMQGRLGLAPSRSHLAVRDRIAEILDTEFPRLAAQAEVTVTGRTMLQAMTADMVATEFLKSMAVALAVISVLIGLVFRSASLAMISLLPNTLPILLPLSAFGLLEIPLSAPAAFVASIALGVCVDDTIHLLAKYVAAQRSGKVGSQAIAEALRQVGTPITVTTIVLILGFGTMLLGSFVPNQLLGSLAAAMIGLAWLFDLFLTPAVLSYLETWRAHRQRVVTAPSPTPMAHAPAMPSGGNP